MSEGSSRRGLKITAGVVAVLALVIGAVSWQMIVLERDPNQLQVGAAAPTLELVGSDGKPFSLAAHAPKALPVLVFYRGHW
ncbi:MAG: hypothetical protein JKY65_00850 [Planctomycetes bacterium]|nr:hypothetical protein [Planctomycetota bacterium]